MKQLFINNFHAKLAAGVTISDSVIPLDSVAGLPALASNEYFLLTVFKPTGVYGEEVEVVKVTAVDTINKTVTTERGHEGGAYAHVAGDAAEARLTAGSLDTITENTPLTPRHFGAVGDGVADDTAAVNAFWTYVADNKVPHAAFTGTFKTTAPINIVPTDPEATSLATSTIIMNAEVFPSLDLSLKQAAVHFERCKYTSFPGTFRVTGGSGSWPQGRTMYNGVRFGTQTTGLTMGTVDVSYPLKWGVYRKGGDSGSGGQAVIDVVKVYRAGPSNVSTEWFNHRNVQSWTNNGLGGRDERSAVTFDGDVPTTLDEEGALVINGEVYTVMQVINATTVEVFPRLSSAIMVGMNTEFACGGAVYQDGNNFGLWTFNVVNAQFCSIGWYDACLYGSGVQTMHLAQAIISGMLGRAPTAPVYGGGIGHLYIEGNSTIRGMISWGEVEYYFSDASTTDRSHFYRIRDNGGGEYTKSPFAGSILTPKERYLPGVANPGNSAVVNETYGVGTTGAAIHTVYNSSGGSSSKNITLRTDQNLNDLEGRSTLYILAVTHEGATPYGSWEFDADNGATVNGANSVLYEQFPGATLFACVYNSELNNWNVHTFIGSRERQMTQSYGPQTLAVDAKASFTLPFAAAQFGDFLDVSINKATSGVEVRGWISAEGEVTVQFENRTGASVDIAAGNILCKLTKAVEDVVPTNIAISNTSVANGQTGAIIGTISATDPDSTLTYDFYNGDGVMEVIGDQLKFIDSYTTDYATQSSFEVYIKAIDGSGSEAQDLVTVTVQPPA
nr:cadherin repeat domain-containing protein [uncultured Halomonas sp.]